MTAVGISRCLGFDNCRYDGGKFNTNRETVKVFLEDQGIDSPEFSTACPEQAGGLPTPRVPSEIVGGNGNDVWEGSAKVKSNNGQDVTKEFKLGAIEALKSAVEKGISVFVLKERSPSCGTEVIYDGTFNGKKIPGLGVTSALLQKCGIKVFSDKQVEDFAKAKNLPFEENAPPAPAEFKGIKITA